MYRYYGAGLAQRMQQGRKYEEDRLFQQNGTKALTYNYYDAGSAKEFVGLQYKFKIAGELYILSDTEPADQKQNASPKEIHWLDDDTAVIDDMKIKVKFTYPKILTES